MPGKKTKGQETLEGSFGSEDEMLDKFERRVIKIVKENRRGKARDEIQNLVEEYYEGEE